MKWNRIISWSLIILAFLFIIRIFACQSIKLESYEMASTVLPKDRLLVSKFWTGARLPTTVLGLPGPQRKYIDKVRLPYLRLPAIKRFTHDDIVVFNDPRLTDIPLDRKPLIVSRIVGLPGDTVLIWDKNLYINRKITETPIGVRREYRIVSDGTQISDEFLTKHKIEVPDMIADIGIWDYYMDTIAYQGLSALSNVKQVRTQLMRHGDSSSGYWPYSSFYKWNRDQLGPLVVPYKGLSVVISLNTIDQYRELIENHEMNELLIDFRGININGEFAQSYTFKKDYYFVMDDNRDNPNDSRIFGLVPKDHLIGKVKRKLWTSGKKSFLKSID